MAGLIPAELKKNADILPVHKEDRRRLSKVPDKEAVRTNLDRRRMVADTGGREVSAEEAIMHDSLGRRYLVNIPVSIEFYVKGSKRKCVGRCTDLSTTGLLAEVGKTGAELLKQADADRINLKFEITPGALPEGYEMKVNMGANCVRAFINGAGQGCCGMEFHETLAQYATKHKNWYMLSAASFFLFLATAFIMLMRAESVLYFQFNKALYAYSIVAATFLLSRYLFGAFYRPVFIKKDYTPGVTIIIPCFNEEDWIQKTILSCVNQDYPVEQLEIVVIDDCSADASYAKIVELVEDLKVREARHEVDGRVKYYRLPENAGKRDALAKGVEMSTKELVTVVDSDSFLDPFAIRNIVQPFRDAEMGGVSGRTDVANAYTNALTKMQTVRYYIAFRVMKAAESYFDAVTCLSGPLSCYRKDLLLRYMDEWINQKFLGEKATFGDDRSMTNFILRYDRTCYQDTATCATIVPNTHRVFLKQQMRWKRSWLRESLIAARYMWKKEPFMALFFYMGLVVPFLAPIIVIYNLIYIPLLHRVFPLTFVVGLFLMAFLMSMAQLFLRKSSTWIYGLWFCLYYEAVLLWQMPVAWFTFWKSTWGTRMTPADIAEQQKS